MSVVLGYVRDGVVTLAASARTVASGEKRAETGEVARKIRRLDNGILLAVTGDDVARQGVIASPQPFTLDEKGELTKKHIVAEILPELWERCLREGRVESTDDEEDRVAQCEILLAFRDKLYCIDRRLHVSRVTKYVACGLLYGYVCAPLLRIGEGKDPEKALVRALESASAYTDRIGAPYLVADTKRDGIRTYGEV